MFIFTYKCDYNCVSSRRISNRWYTLYSASGRFVYEGQVALSRDLFKKGIKYGDKVEIEGLGEFVVEDKMNSRFKDSIDIFSFDRNKGFKVEKVVKIYYKCR